MKRSYYVIIAVLFTTTSLFAQVDYDTEIQPIFNSKCTSCHGGTSGLTLTSYNSLFGSTGEQYGTNIVIPSDPNASGLVDKIEPNPQFGVRMPQGGMLDQSQIDLIRTWITEGANAVASSSEEESIVPDNFRLFGNYPNPFNPSTQIQFDVPFATQYTISIYTMHGKLIAEQIGNVSAGRVQIPVNLNGNPTGTYLYKVTALSNGATQFIGTGRMTLIK
tara:strand:- start:74145 stop:74801 length:657 start_codon:yes stop_codon:yes gene_type:complete